MAHPGFRGISRRRFLGTAAGAAALAASGGRSVPLVGARSARAQGGQRVRALMWINSPTIDANFEKRIQMFNDAHAGEIEVALEFLPYDQYWQKLQLA